MALRDNKRVERSLKEYVTRPEMAFRYDAQHADTDLLRFDTEFLKEEMPREGRILDVGCGTGRHLLALSDNGRRVVGMDLSEHMLDISAAKLERAEVAARLVRADMRNPLPFRNGSFDGAICMFSTLGLIPSGAERVEFVREVRRVLKPGGVFAFHVHNRWHNLVSGWGRLWLLRTYLWDRFFSGLEPGDRLMARYGEIRGMYLHVFSLGEVRELIVAGGMELRRVFYLNEERTGEVEGRWRGVRANGFIVAAEKPHTG
jgi:SAM-dependent methyltransferase